MRNASLILFALGMMCYTAPKTVSLVLLGQVPFSTVYAVRDITKPIILDHDESDYGFCIVPHVRSIVFSNSRDEGKWVKLEQETESKCWFMIVLNQIRSFNVT